MRTEVSRDHAERASDARVTGEPGRVRVLAPRTVAAVRMLRTVMVACVLGIALSACEGSNAFEPCPDSDTPHTPCEPTRS